ncbi:MAG TPA: hypothetical protein VJH34_02210 [archaeon]|nr:hypothetical protein [archaeon]
MEDKRSTYTLHKVYTTVDNKIANLTRIECDYNHTFLIDYRSALVGRDSLLLAKWKETTGKLEELYTVTDVKNGYIEVGYQVKGWGKIQSRIPLSDVKDLRKIK